MSSSSLSPVRQLEDVVHRLGAELDQFQQLNPATSLSVYSESDDMEHDLWWLEQFESMEAEQRQKKLKAAKHAAQLKYRLKKKKRYELMKKRKKARKDSIQAREAASQAREAASVAQAMDAVANASVLSALVCDYSKKGCTLTGLDRKKLLSLLNFSFCALKEKVGTLTPGSYRVNLPFVNEVCSSCDLTAIVGTSGLVEFVSFD